MNWAYGNRYGGKEWCKRELVKKRWQLKTIINLKKKEKVTTGWYLNEQGLEKDRASEAFTSAQNLTGCQNLVAKINKTSMQYLQK